MIICAYRELGMETDLFAGYISDDELDRLYADARLDLMSLYEGFVYPLEH